LGKRDGYAIRVFAQPDRHIFHRLLYLKNGHLVKENPLKKDGIFRFFFSQKNNVRNSLFKLSSSRFFPPFGTAKKGDRLFFLKKRDSPYLTSQND
jgi:hypothetical protein